MARAEIAFEHAAGPVLMLSGEDDAMWPSARLTRIAEARAEREGAGDRVTHVAYPAPGTSAPRRRATRSSPRT